MPQYLMIAEKVYKKIKEDDLFSNTPTEHLNNLIGVIRKEIKGTKFKLKYNFIDFDECLTKPLDECAVKIDISLMPSHKNKDEYILWFEPYRVCRRVNILRDYPDDKTKLYPRN